MSRLDPEEIAPRSQRDEAETGTVAASLPGGFPDIRNCQSNVRALSLPPLPSDFVPDIPKGARHHLARGIIRQRVTLVT